MVSAFNHRLNIVTAAPANFTYTGRPHNTWKRREREREREREGEIVIQYSRLHLYLLTFIKVVLDLGIPNNFLKVSLQNKNIISLNTSLKIYRVSLV